MLPAQEGGILSWLLSLATLPLRYFVSTLGGIINICLSIIRGGGPHGTRGTGGDGTPREEG